MIQPFSDHVLVRPFLSEETTSGGIVLPQTSQKEIDQGEVLAVGPGKVIDGSLRPVAAKVGDHVVYSKYGGKEVELHEEKLLLMRESDLLGKFVSEAVTVRD